MANPQIENGYTKIANELLDAIGFTEVSGQKLRLLFIVIRLTYGFNRKSTPISISDFTKYTGISNTTRISQITNKLEDSNFISIQRRPGKTKVYAINKDYTQWTGFDNKAFDTLSKHKDHSLTNHKEYTLSKPKQHFMKNEEIYNEPKESIKERIYIDHFETFWKEYPRKIAKAKAEKIFLKLKPDETLLNQILQALEIQKQSKQWQDKQFIPHPTTWLTQERWNDVIQSETPSTGIMV